MITNTQNTFQTHRLATAVGVALGLLSAIPAYAQEADTPQSANAEEGVTEVIEVVGIRGSLENALLKKRASEQILDAISAEDIGQLPDENIAEALQRVTGVQITRDAGGEGDQVQIRGLTVTNVQMNGVAMAGNDFRTSNFQDFSSSIVSAIEVYKTPSADQVEGGIGGMINLKTKRPTQLKERLASINVEARYTDSTDTYTPQGTITLGDNWRLDSGGKFGVIAALSFDKRDNRGDTANVNNYRAYEYGRAGDPFADFNQDGTIDENDNFIFPNGHRVRARGQEYDRQGAQVALEWKPSKNFSVALDTSYFSRDSSASIHQFTIGANNNRRSVVSVADPSNPVVVDRTINIVGNDGTVPFAVLAAGTVDNALLRLNADPSYSESDRETFTYALSTRYDTENVRIEAELSSSRLTNDNFRSEANYRIEDVDVSYTFDLTQPGDRPFWSFDVDGNPLEATSPLTPGLSLASTQLDRSHYENKKDAFKLDLTHFVEWGVFTNYKVGIRTADENIDRTQRYRGGVGGDVTAGDPLFDTCTQDLGFDNFLGGLSGGYVRNWVSGVCTHQQMLDAVGLDTIATADNRRPDDSIEESSDSAYIKVSFDHEIGDTEMNISGNFGLRYTKAEITATGTVESAVLDTNGDITFDDRDRIITEDNIVPFDGDYSYVLPSLNVNWQLNSDMVVRLGLAKVVQRPAIGRVRPDRDFLNATRELDGVEYIVDANNSNLQPREAKTYDLSWEWYFDKGAYVSIAPFFKDWEVEQQDQVIDIQYGNQILPTRMPVNIDAEFGDIKGVEFGYQQPFTFLPGFWKHFGVNFNYSMVDIEKDPGKLDVEGNARALRVRISDDSANFALWFDNKRFSARLAGNWRTDYEIGAVSIADDQRVVPGASGALVMMQNPTIYWDLSMNYYVTSKFRVNMAINNLFDEVKSNYASYDELIRGTSWSGTNWKVGIRYDF